MDTTERGDSGWNEAQRKGENRVILLIILIMYIFFKPIVKITFYIPSNSNKT